MNLLSILIHASIGAAVIIAVAGLSIGLFRRALSASVRHAIWELSIVSVLALPLLGQLVPAHNVAVPVRYFAMEQSKAPRATQTPAVTPTSVAAANESRAIPALGANQDARNAPVPSFPAPVASASRRVDAAAAPVRTNWALIATLIWALGAGLLLVRLAVSIALTRRIICSVRRGDAQFPESALAEGRAKVVVASPEIGPVSPMTWGVLKPVIVFPASSLEWPADRRRAALIHELGHVTRRDWLVQTISLIACALYWFHPLVWLAARQIRAESERACDDLVLTSGSINAAEYARHLLEIARTVRNFRLARTGAIAMAQSIQIEPRLRAVLAEKSRRGAISRLATITLSAVVLIMVALGASVRLSAQPTALQKPAQGDQTIVSATSASGQIAAPSKAVGSTPVQTPPPAPSAQTAPVPAAFAAPSEPTGTDSSTASQLPSAPASSPPPSVPQTVRPLVVLIDPGHGGKDSGALVAGQPAEKDLTLQIATKLSSILRSEGVTVYMSRATDQFVSLPDRDQLAIQDHADLLVSIHCDKENSQTDSGALVYYHNASTAGSLLASEIADGIGASIASYAHRTSSDFARFPGVGMQVLRNAPVPAALCECGYISSPSDLKLLIDPAGQQRIAAGIANGVLKFASSPSSALGSSQSATPEANVQGPQMQLVGLYRAWLTPILDLRSHLAKWGSVNRGYILRMRQAGPNDLGALMRVYNSYDRLPFPLWSSDPRTASGNAEPQLGMETPVGLTLTHLRRSTENIDRVIRQDFAIYRDFRVAATMTPGPCNLTLWASGRITESLVESVRGGLGKPDRMSRTETTIVPPFGEKPVLGKNVHGLSLPPSAASGNSLP